MSEIKAGDFVVVKSETKTGVVLSVSTFVQYEGSYARVLFGADERTINTSLLTKVE